MRDVPREIIGEQACSTSKKFRDNAPFLSPPPIPHPPERKEEAGIQTRLIVTHAISRDARRAQRCANFSFPQRGEAGKWKSRLRPKISRENCLPRLSDRGTFSIPRTTIMTMISEQVI